MVVQRREVKMARSITQVRGRVGRHTQDRGRQCQNYPADQWTVIDLLNRITFADGGAQGGLSKHIISGTSSDELYRAISSFEDKQFRGSRRGYVDPGGAMLKRMKNLAVASAQIAPKAVTTSKSPTPDNPNPHLIYTVQFRQSANGNHEYDENLASLHFRPDFNPCL
jgi:hypothetical protein